ncbi:MAG: sigma-54 dependent transcriptional regulator [Bacteroidales bacterium]
MEKKTGHILIVDDNKGALSALSLLLQFEFETVVTLSNPNRIYEELRKTDFDLLLLDMNFSAGENTGNEGLYWLQEIKKMAPTVEVVMITAYGDIELAVKALKRGAADFVVKPWENEKLLATLKAALRLKQSNQEVKKLRDREKNLKQEWNSEQKMIIGSSPAMEKVMQLVRKVAATDANVLITGENGTGKELVAREIHRRSERANELMVTVDMGAIPENLFESELFGHKKGAFTDAKEDRTGKFQMADKGTLFLDEIGNLPYSLQSKLLVVLENRSVLPVGSDQPVPVNIRLVSATNRDLQNLIQTQQFREDLLYRINTIQIHVPPLRERGEDIEELAAFFLKRYGKKYQKPDLRLDTQAVKKLRKYHWPGNIRELQHTLEKAVILAESNILSANDFIFQDHTGEKEEQNKTLEEMEKEMIEQTLDQQNWNFTAAADQLGITRQTLYNKIKRYDL